MRCRWVVLGLGVALALVSSAQARLGTVQLKDGTNYDGDVAEDSTDNSVTVDVHGTPFKFKRANVESIIYTDEVDAQVRAKAATLGANDAQGRLDLAHYALEHHALPAARDLLLDVLRITPGNDAAKADLERVRNMLSAQSPSTPATAPVATTAPTTPAPPTTTPPPTQQKPEGGIMRTVTPDEINWIRQVELREGDSVRVKVDPELRKRFADYMNMPLADLNRMSPMDQAMLILQKGKKSMRQEVKILNDPPALATYRREVNRMVVTGCAAARCHGSSTALPFRLFPQDNDASVYSNFVTLQKYRQAVKGGQALMIDRQSPDASLLLSFLLPPELTDQPHPENKLYRGVVRNRTDPRLLQTQAWIRDGLNPVQPDYAKIDLTRPVPTESNSTSGRAAAEGSGGR